MHTSPNASSLSSKIKDVKSSDVKRFISRLWVKKRYSQLENDRLHGQSSSHETNSGRSIEILPADDQYSQCHPETNESFPEHCSEFESQTAKTRKRVHFAFAPDTETEEGRAFCSVEGGCHPTSSSKHRKRKRKLKKAKKITWRVMKGGWKMFKAGLIMVTQSPTVLTSTVTVTNIIHNSAADIHKYSTAHTCSNTFY